MKKTCTIIMALLIALTALGLTACGGSQFKVAWPNAELLGSDKTITADYTGIPSTGYEWTVELEGEGVLLCLQGRRRWRDPHHCEIRPQLGNKPRRS